MPEELAICPCCGSIRERSETEFAAKAIEKLNSGSEDPHKDGYSLLINFRQSWACDPCLHRRKAIAAKPSDQKTMNDPSLAYFDNMHRCAKCDWEFVFAGTDKKSWYEANKFMLNSEPRNCKDCRADEKTLKEENKKLAEAIRASEDEEIILKELKWSRWTQ